nr:mucin-2-like [Cherax quadricarinatus]
MKHNSTFLFISVVVLSVLVHTCIGEPCPGDHKCTHMGYMIVDEVTGEAGYCVTLNAAPICAGVDMNGNKLTTKASNPEEIPITTTTTAATTSPITTTTITTSKTTTPTATTTPTSGPCSGDHKCTGIGYMIVDEVTGEAGFCVAPNTVPLCAGVDINGNLLTTKASDPEEIPITTTTTAATTSPITTTTITTS